MLSRFKYYKPQDLGEAVSYLQKEDKAFILAGGTDLMIMLRRNFIDAEHIVDIKALPETTTFEFKESAGLTIGASVNVNRVVDSEIVKVKYPALNQAASSLASFQLRNRATVVGNICNASPGADLPPALLIYDTLVNIAGPDGLRQLPLHEFFTGVKRTVLQKGEIVVSVQLPDPGEGDKAPTCARRAFVGTTWQPSVSPPRQSGRHCRYWHLCRCPDTLETFCPRRQNQPTWLVRRNYSLGSRRN